MNDTKTPAAEKPKAAAQEESFFPGSGEFKPITVKAADQKEATEIWEKTRELEN